MRKTELENFERHIDKSGDCWLWTASTVGNGYGQFHNRLIRGKYAHRYSFRITNGHLPEDLLVLHKCDTPRCVRPDHLFLGTYKDNSDDKIAKGRYRNGSSPGEKNPRHKLSSAEVLAIRADSRGATEIAQEKGIDRTTVHRIRTGRSWRCV